MARFFSKAGDAQAWLAVCVLILALTAWGQNAGTDKARTPTVDAPSATKPSAPLPSVPVSPRNTPGAADPAPAPETEPGAQDAPAGATDGSQGPGGQASGQEAVPPMGGREDLFRLTKEVNFVQVPVTVKDEDGQLIPGLLRDDFTVMEDGVKQRITYFTSDPFPLSAALVFDLSMPDTEVNRVQQTLSALVGAFSEFDEVGIYTYGSTVRKMQEFTAATGEILAVAMARLRKQQGRTGGVPVVGGPMGMPTPTVNGPRIDPSLPPGGTPTGANARVVRPDSRVLNDAILEAALDLEQRDPTRRKVLFVISDGREYGSKTTSGEVMKVLLSNQISLYAVAVGSAAIPGYGRLDRIDIPGGGTPNILHRYSSATGGQVYTELTISAIEDAYTRITREARNQYTLGYTTPATPSSSYRTIEVLVHRPQLRVYAKDGYYPLPARRR